MRVIATIWVFISLCAVVRAENTTTSNFIVSNNSIINFSEIITNPNSTLQQGEYEIVPVHKVMQKGYKILVFPNPTSDIINIKINTSPKGGFNVSVFSFSGKKMTEAIAEKDVLQINLDLSFLENGSYLLKVADNKGGHLQTFQVIKN